MSNNARILLFHTRPDKARQIETLCRRLGIQVLQIKPSSYNQTLGYLAGISGFQRENAAYIGAELPSEMMVFSGIDPDRLDLFLEEYKKASIPSMKLKAILTPQNIRWSAEALYRELYKEYQQYSTKEA